MAAAPVVAAALCAADLLAIHRLLSDFAWHADHGDAHELAALFLPEGVLCLNDALMQGQAQIEADCGRRFVTADRKTRHLWSNVRAEPTGPSTARATLVQMTFEQGGTGQPVQGRVSDVVDLLQRGDDGCWRFVHRTITRVLLLGA